MVNWFSCFDCQKVMPVTIDAIKCISCGSTRGELLPPERVKEGFEAGAYFNIDPKTGKRAKHKR